MHDNADKQWAKGVRLDVDGLVASIDKASMGIQQVLELTGGRQLTGITGFSDQKLDYIKRRVTEELFLDPKLDDVEAHRKKTDAIASHLGHLVGANVPSTPHLGRGEIDRAHDAAQKVLIETFFKSVDGAITEQTNPYKGRARS